MRGQSCALALFVCRFSVLYRRILRCKIIKISKVLFKVSSLLAFLADDRSLYLRWRDCACWFGCHRCRLGVEVGYCLQGPFARTVLYLIVSRFYFCVRSCRGRVFMV